MSISTTLSFRRSAFASPPPIAGAFVASKTGKSVWAVTKVTLFRRSGDPVSRDTIRMRVDRMQLKAVPAGANVQPWPIVAKVPVTLPVPAAVRFRELAAKVAQPVGAKSRKQVKRDAARAVQIRLDDLESPVPAAQRHAVMSPDGTVFSPPKVSKSSWSDPDDSSPNRRTRKLSHGYRPTDAIAVLRRSNPAVEAGHVVACDLYRMAWERGPGGAFPGGRDLCFSDRQFAPSTGPAEYRCDGMRIWSWLQAQFRPRAQAMLHDVVLCGMAVTKWSEKQHGDRRYWVGYIISTLDQLLIIYDDDVRTLMKQEHINLD